MVANPAGKGSYVYEVLPISDNGFANRNAVGLSCSETMKEGIRSSGPNVVPEEGTLGGPDAARTSSSIQILHKLNAS